MKKKGLFFHCVTVPFLAAAACLLLIVIFHQIPVRNLILRPLLRLGPMFAAKPIAYYRIVDTISLLAPALFCCRSIFKSKDKKKMILALGFAVVLSVAFSFGSSYIFTLTGRAFRLTAWGLGLNFLVAFAALVIFNLFFTEEFRQSWETQEAMERARKEAEEQARLATFLHNPAARNTMAKNAVAYKGHSHTDSAIKGAVIGGVVAGPAGAVVGAIAGQNKAEQKAKAGVPDPARQAVAYKKDDGTKTIIKDAVIGGVVAGPAGAVVGAIVGKNKVDKEKEK